MFDKLFKRQPDQSQTISNMTINGGVVQQAQAGRDLTQSQFGQVETKQEITKVEVVQQLEKLTSAVTASELSLEQQAELLDYLRPAKREVCKETTNKMLVGENLKQFSETLKTVQETTETGKTLWATAQEVFKTVSPWLGVAIHFFGT